MSQVNEPTLNSPCFCGSPCKEHLSRLKCGVALDYTAINDSIKNVKGRSNKDHILNGTALGCKLDIKKEDYQDLPPRMFSLPLKTHPKCHHHLYAKTCVSTQNKTRTAPCSPALFSILIPRAITLSGRMTSCPPQPQSTGKKSSLWEVKDAPTYMNSTLWGVKGSVRIEMESRQHHRPSLH